MQLTGSKLIEFILTKYNNTYISTLGQYISRKELKSLAKKTEIKTCI